MPVNDYNQHGETTVKHWELTREYLIEKIDGLSAIYAVTLHKGKNLCDTGSDDEFYNFIKYLIKRDD